MGGGIMGIRCVTVGLLSILWCLLWVLPGSSKGETYKTKTGGVSVIHLPEPVKDGPVSLEETLAVRESMRQYSDASLTLTHISQLLWAGQGITRDWGGRTAPSAGGLYPLELYVVLPEGVYRYVPHKNQLLRHLDGNVSGVLSRAALGQHWVRSAPLVIVICAVYERVCGKYGKRGERYVTIEVGHVAQNIILQAVSLGLGSVPVGAFHDEQVRNALRLPEDHEPLYLIPIGHIQ